MTIGYFTAPQSREILVVMNYKQWIREVLQHGFPITPMLTREANTPELVAYAERGDKAPLWTYSNYYELIDDEITSGASHKHLAALQRLTMQVMDNAPEPQKATQL